MRNEEELFLIMERMMELYDAAPDELKEKMEPILKIGLHIKEFADELHKMGGDEIFDNTEELKRIDMHLVRAIKVAKRITKGDENNE